MTASARSSGHVGGSPLGSGDSKTTPDGPASHSKAIVATWADGVLTIVAKLLNFSTSSQRLAS